MDKIPAINECRPEVLAFARLMEYKLRKNDWKGGWKNWHPAPAHSFLQREVIELRNALLAHADCEDVAYEAADVANFALMIADMTGGLGFDSSKDDDDG